MEDNPPATIFPRPLRISMRFWQCSFQNYRRDPSLAVYIATTVTESS